MAKLILKVEKAAMLLDSFKIFSLILTRGTVICAWGEDGAAARSTSGDLVTSPIFPPKSLVDTLGAGDTFNAATMFALSKDRSVGEAITFGCKIAGAKCGLTGYKGLKGLQNML